MTRFFATLILLAGSFTSANAAVPAGSLDPEFGVDGRRMFLEQATASSSLSHPAQTIQPDGKRLVAGSTGNDRGYGYVALARFLPNGQLDAQFGTAGMVTTDLGDSAAHGIGLLPDGKIVVLATKAAHEGYALIRYHGDGSLDSTFGTEGVALRTISHGGGSPLGLVVYPNGKTVVAVTIGGFLSLYSHGPNGDGNPDFATAPADLRFNGFNAMESYKTILLQPDGKIVIGGLSENTSAPPVPIGNFGLLRLNPDGSLDTTFNGSGRLTTTFGTTHIHRLGSMALGSDGKLVMAGTTGSHVVLARYLPNGMLDTSLGGSGKVIVTPGALSDFNIDPIGVAIQAEGKIVLSGPGGKSGIIGPTKFCLTRLLADGTLDSNFAGNGFLIPEEPLSAFFAKDILCDTDGRILLAGSQSFDGKTQVTVYRLNADGPLDTSFDNDGYAHAAFQTGLYSRDFKAVAELPDGKIIVAGESLSRLLADGTLDTSFGTEGLVT
ncbi:MAG TPA: hypothetical protein DCP71_02115, partial [Verrucomicrobiales bacterium]|nr:hypothetical protein [Verrucomicrobiales bacterium]